jgi:poly(hydroxyalkanoate) depolymerase family esterase
MTGDMQRTMHEAMQLMRSGDLAAATRAIQRGLLGGAGEAAHAHGPRGSTHDWIDGAYRVVPEETDVREREAETAAPPREMPGGAQPATFAGHHFACTAGSLNYKLFVPAGLGDAKAPLLVMLHGCTQSPDDFARGTRMNALAQAHGYVVAYPEQAPSRNPSRCWNWFRKDDQRRGQGEPAMLAALTAYLVKTHGLDERRVYAAGLSAGGAMATVLAATYPEVYAAIGVHSGLPFGAAHDLPSAYAAMKRGRGRRSPARGASGTRPVPAIVFHGDGDTTVDPCNGAAVIAQCLDDGMGTGAQGESPQAEVQRGTVPGGRGYTRTIYRSADGAVAAEQWVVHGAAHAWSGGDAAGSYTDPSGPDASAQMLRFFSACARPGDEGGSIDDGSGD